MNALTFKRGIHPPDGKEFTDSKQIKIVMPKEKDLLIIPMSQHLGAPCNPIVQKGDRVLLGQKIGDSEAFVSAPIHATVSGTVNDIKPMITPNGTLCNSIIIENDGKFEEDPSMGKVKDISSYTREETLSLIREAGIVGLGGAGFPTHIKLNPPKDKKIDSIILNASECEPYLTTDHRVLLEKTDRVVRGLEIILKLFPDAKGYIAIEINKLDAIDILSEAVKDIPNIEVVPLKTKYPQGSEKQLIYAVKKREVLSGTLPADSGCIVNNVDTVLAVERALVHGRPLMRRIITLTGGAVKNYGNYQVRLGMTFRDLIEAAGGLKEEAKKIISGGPMMGISISSLDVPIIKTSSAIICLTEKEAYLPPERNCIRCGKCVSNCPMGLLPIELNQNVLMGDFDLFRKNNGLDCIECGSCSYMCPSKRHLAQTIRATRRSLMAAAKK